MIFSISNLLLFIPRRLLLDGGDDDAITGSDSCSTGRSFPALRLRPRDDAVLLGFDTREVGSVLSTSGCCEEGAVDVGTGFCRGNSGRGVVFFLLLSGFNTDTGTE